MFINISLSPVISHLNPLFGAIWRKDLEGISVQVSPRDIRNTSENKMVKPCCCSVFYVRKKKQKKKQKKKKQQQLFVHVISKFIKADENAALLQAR